MTNPRNKLQKKFRKQLIKAFGGKCVICGSIENLEFAHVKPTKLSGIGRGRKERYYDVLRNPDCYALTCKEHNNFVGVKDIE